ncbi:MAG TPA: hypothetical protein VD815_09695 [Candidatus Saccharimonadales bacterium]|nr:hypothetical protein [Candidatus Saccharimonadales bacterium]
MAIASDYDSKIADSPSNFSVEFFKKSIPKRLVVDRLSHSGKTNILVINVEKPLRSLSSSLNYITIT